MFKKSLALAAATLFVAASATATPLTFNYDAGNDVYSADLFGAAGTNTYTFSFPFDSVLSGAVDTSTTTVWSNRSKMFVTTGTALTGVSLDGAALSFDKTVLSTATHTSSGMTSYSWAIQDFSLASGLPHTLQIHSTGAVAGNLTVTPAVPEAGALGMAVAGLAVVGLLARRRQSN